MKRLSIVEAVAIVPVSESTLRRDIKAGKVSAEKDERGNYQIDPAELTRAYDVAMDTQPAPADHSEIITLKDNQIADLRSQLAKAEAREDALIQEKARLLNLTDRLTLMLPPAPKEKRSNWLARLIGAH